MPRFHMVNRIWYFMKVNRKSKIKNIEEGDRRSMQNAYMTCNTKIKYYLIF